MSTLFEKFGKRYAEYKTRQGRHQARSILLSQGNAVLEDLGISRELLESGVNAWPWKTTVEQPVPVAVTLSAVTTGATLFTVTASVSVLTPPSSSRHPAR